jgi:Zn-dependent peptidase ImmA (M78 family)
MLLSDLDIEFCLRKAEEIAELYRQIVLNSAATRRSVDELRRLCTEYLAKNVKVLEIADEPRAIRGYYVRYPDHYDIVLYAGMDAAWKRFVLCKELFHVILDEDAKYRTISIYEHVAEVMTTFPVHDSTPGPAATSEMMAEIAAMEFLFPCRSRIKLLKGPAIDFDAIAEMYQIPQALVEEYLSESYMKNLSGFVR